MLLLLHLQCSNPCTGTGLRNHSGVHSALVRLCLSEGVPIRGPMHPEGGMSLGVNLVVSLQQMVVAGSWKYSARHPVPCSSWELKRGSLIRLRAPVYPLHIDSAMYP